MGARIPIIISYYRRFKDLASTFANNFYRFRPSNKTQHL